MIDRPPNARDRERYRTWENRLETIRIRYELLQRAIGTSREDMRRARFQEAARSIDGIEPPHPWVNWQHLGKAIYAQPRPAVSEHAGSTP